MSLKQKLRQARVTSDMLDGLVHDAASRIASRVNNDGLIEQIDFITSAGITEQEIEDEVNASLRFVLATLHDMLETADVISDACLPSEIVVEALDLATAISGALEGNELTNIQEKAKATVKKWLRASDLKESADSFRAILEQLPSC